VSETSGVSKAVRDMIERLIAFDTTSRNSNLELIEDVRGYLAGLGVESHLTYDDERRKANLYATLGPTDRGGIALSGHSDVVPVDGQDWSSDPWTVTERDGRLYGRGTCDMKAFIAVALAHAPRFLAADLGMPLHICLSYDEEVGCQGVPRMLAFLAERPVRPRACIVGEPTEMRVIVGHKGKLSCRAEVRGLESHSALAPRGVNAVHAAARLVARLADMAKEKATQGPFDEDYAVPYTTVHCGVIRGGTALNIVPAHCSVDFEIRYLPQDDPQALFREVQDFARSEIEPEMKAVSPEAGFAWRPISAFPGLDTAPDHEIVTLVKGLVGANATGKVDFGTEAGLFQQSGIPAVICGPGSILQAHKPDEFIALEQVALCERFMERLLDRLTRS